MSYTQTSLYTCLLCGKALRGRQRKFCSDAHRKAHRRAQAKQTGDLLKQYADKNLSALSAEDASSLADNLRTLLKWERINESNPNPNTDSQRQAHKVVADVMQLILEGVSGRE